MPFPFIVSHKHPYLYPHTLKTKHTHTFQIWQPPSLPPSLPHTQSKRVRLYIAFALGFFPSLYHKFNHIHHACRIFNSLISDILTKSKIQPSWRGDFERHTNSNVMPANRFFKMPSTKNTPESENEETTPIIADEETMGDDPKNQLIDDKSQPSTYNTNSAPNSPPTTAANFLGKFKSSNQIFARKWRKCKIIYSTLPTNRN